MRNEEGITTECTTSFLYHVLMPYSFTTFPSDVPLDSLDKDTYCYGWYFVWCLIKILCFSILHEKRIFAPGNAGFYSCTPPPPPALSLQPCTIISLFLNQSVASCFDFCFRFFYQVSQRAIRGGNNIFFFKIMKFKFIFIDEYNHWNRTPTHTQTHTIIFQRYKSFKKLLKSIGPKIDPWVTQGS